MCASKVFQKPLRDALGSMHALRSRVLLRAVEATIHGSRLTLIRRTAGQSHFLLPGQCGGVGYGPAPARESGPHCGCLALREPDPVSTAQSSRSPAGTSGWR